MRRDNALTVSVPVPLRLRPLEIGDLLDETFRMYRRHFFLFAGISVIVSIPAAALSGFSYYALLGGLLTQTGNGQPEVSTLQASLVGIGIGAVVNLALTPFYYGAVTFAACESALGRPVTAGGVVRAVLRRYLQLLGYWRRTFLIIFLLLIIFTIIRAALGAFITLGLGLLQIVVSSVVVLWISAAVSVIIDSLVNPVLQIAIVLIYFDLRVRREALDLFQLAQRVAGPQPVA